MSAIKQKHSDFTRDLRLKALRERLEEGRGRSAGKLREDAFEAEERLVAAQRRVNQLVLLNELASLPDVLVFVTQVRETLQRVELRDLPPVSLVFLELKGPARLSGLIQRYSGSLEVLRELTWILLTLFAGTSAEQSQRIAAEGGFVPLFAKMLVIPDAELLENVLLGLANLVSDCPALVKAVKDCGVMDEINHRIEQALAGATPEALQRDKPVDLVGAYVLLVKHMYQKQPSLRLGETGPLLAFSMHVVLERFGSRWLRQGRLAEDFLDLLRNVLEYSVDRRPALQDFLMAQPTFDGLVRTVTLHLTDQVFYEEHNDAWLSMAQFLMQVVDGFDHRFYEGFLHQKAVGHLLGCVLARVRMAELATFVVASLVSKDVDWNDPRVGRECMEDWTILGLLLQAFARWSAASEKVKVNVLEIFRTLLSRHQRDLERLALDHPEAFRPIYDVFDSGQSAEVLVETLRLLTQMVSIDTGEEDWNSHAHPCRDWILEHEHMVTHFLGDDHGPNDARIREARDALKLSLEW